MRTDDLLSHVSGASSQAVEFSNTVDCGHHGTPSFNLSRASQQAQTNYNTLLPNDKQFKEIAAHLALTPAVAGSSTWPSQYTHKVHQKSVGRVLSTSLSEADMKTLQKAVADADKPEYQTIEMSYRHAMTPKGMSKDEARQKANEFVRSEILFAQKLEAAGDRESAMYRLGMAIHCLQDSTSPAHANFRVYEGGDLELGSHVWEELFDPGSGSRLDEATTRAYRYFKGTLEMPSDFFANLGHDTNN